MEKQGQLFSLIKSLDASEKRYFKLFCQSQNEASNYLRLFDFIEKQEEFDEKALKNAFPGEKFINQLHVTKIYLTQLILKSLRNYHSKLSKQAEILDLLREVEILFVRELYPHCYHVLQKAEKMARKYERTHLLAEIIFWKRKLQLAMEGPAPDAMKKIGGQMQEVIDQQENLNDYWSLITSATQFFSPGNEKQGIGEKEIQEKAGEPLTTGAAILKYHILYSQGVLGRKSQQAEDNINSLIQLLEAKEHLIKDDPVSYLNTLNNKVTFLIMHRRYDEALNILKEVREVPDQYGIKKSNKQRIRTLLRTYNVELELYRDLKEIEKSKTLMLTIQEFLKKYEKSVPQNYYILFWNQFANIYFMDQNLSQSLYWLNKIIQTRFSSRMDIQRYARLLHLVIHFDLGNIIFLRYSIDSCRRFMKKDGNLTLFEKLCLKHFAKLSHIARSEYPLQFRKFQNDLFVKNKGLVTESTLDYLDIKTWLAKKTPAGEKI